MNVTPKTFKRAIVLALASIGAMGAGIGAAQAHYYTTRCDDDGDRCYRVLCDDDGDSCRRADYDNSYYRDRYYGRGYYGGYGYSYGSPSFSFGYNSGGYYNHHDDWRRGDDDDD